jgi:3-deoxy-D-manno-octulosonic-acid transferase
LSPKELSYRMFWWFYDFIFWFGLILAAPHYLLRMRKRGGYAQDFGERFGCYNETKRKKLQGKELIWIHAVSVGEVNLAFQLIEEIKKAEPKSSLLLSTTTSTGHALALQKLPSDVPVIYYPLDSRFCFRQIHRFAKIKAIILIEAELWPNHLRFCNENKIPVALINARISKRTLPRYKKFHWLFEPAFKAFRLVTTQTPADKKVLIDLGFPAESVMDVGSLKYDTAQDANPNRRNEFQNQFKFLKDRPLILGGSTHPGEEAVLLEIFSRLRKKHSDLILGIAPRHVERTPEICSLLKEHQVPFLLRTDLNGTPPTSIPIIVLNTTGELRYFYEFATAIFIGKSLLGHGGQNIIEPAVLGKPVVFGPNMENFESIAQDFLNHSAAIQIQNTEQLEQTFDRLLSDNNLRSQLSQRAAELISQKKGGMERTLKALLTVIKPNSMIKDY